MSSVVKQVRNSVQRLSIDKDEFENISNFVEAEENIFTMSGVTQNGSFNRYAKILIAVLVSTWL